MCCWKDAWWSSFDLLLVLRKSACFPKSADTCAGCHPKQNSKSILGFSFTEVNWSFAKKGVKINVKWLDPDFILDGKTPDMFNKYRIRLKKSSSVLKYIPLEYIKNGT
ncbi:hypothetical protein Y1Q_0019480 [Alligator mississippiensis]|uniref:Uncharacterized protein n=1 Tax=Alligator mississippiensis TaxID=8496 RepID=A0A151NMQ9_ALLMI|nr:hypothetical protein Y1Q_0019480 [Alligator mississippiensis]